jgi:hypothetical protein
VQLVDRTEANNWGSWNFGSPRGYRTINAGFDFLRWNSRWTNEKSWCCPRVFLGFLLSDMIGMFQSVYVGGDMNGMHHVGGDQLEPLHLWPSMATELILKLKKQQLFWILHANDVLIGPGFIKVWFVYNSLTIRYKQKIPTNNEYNFYNQIPVNDIDTIRSNKNKLTI